MTRKRMERYCENAVILAAAAGRQLLVQKINKELAITELSNPSSATDLGVNSPD